MEIQEGKIGRLIVARFDDKEDLLQCITKVLKEKNIKSGMILFIGALRKTEVVVGPKETIVPPDPMWHSFDDTKEVAGIGTIFQMDGEPKIHIHSTMGRGEKAILGCIRKDSEIFLTIEAVIIEFLDLNIERKFDDAVGFARLIFGKE